MEIINEINNEINNNKNNFFNSIIGKTINGAIDIGLRSILPDLVENQVIDIKNALLENGLKAGIDTAINSVVDFGKSALGIVTGNFENMSQVKIAIGEGGITDTISDILDKAINKTYQKGYIDKNIKVIIESGKNVLLDNITNNIKNEIDLQTTSIEKLEKSINSWKNFYNNKDFKGMTEEYNKINIQLEEIIPLEDVLKETRKLDIIQNLIKNKGGDFCITEEEKKLIENFSS